MHRPTLLIITAVALAWPAAVRAQSSSAQERAAQRARDREERAREREAEQRERERAGVLDTVVAFDARGSVSVSCSGGAVFVIGGSANELRVHARTESGGIRFSASGPHATLEPASGRGCSDGRFEITVPAGARVTATTWSGSASVRGVHGDVDVHAQSGDVDVHDAGGRLEVETLSGSVTVTGVLGASILHTVSGDLTVSGARGDVDVETVSGDIILHDIVARQVRTHGVSGDVTFQGAIADAGRYEFNTHSGGIDLQLPTDIGAELSIATFSGGIDSDFPITLKTGVQAKRLNFTVGRGTARIVAETFSGDVTLRRRK